MVKLMFENLTNTTITQEWHIQHNEEKKHWLELLENSERFRYETLDPKNWSNLALLEAVTEYFINQNTSHNQSVDWVCPNGTQGRREKNWLYLEDALIDLSHVRAGFDTIKVTFDDNSFGTFKILETDALINRIKFDPHDTQLASLPTHITSWMINYRPKIIIIDSFAGRIHGNKATLIGDCTLELDKPIESMKLNQYFDTIYLANDEGRSSKTYRIVETDTLKNTITLDAPPKISDEISSYDIPAGLTKWLPPLKYDLGPGLQHDQGWDHYNGALFIVYQNKVQVSYPWTSYSSRNFKGDSYLLSSIRGNRQYEYRSQSAATSQNINYAFHITKPGDPESPIEARFYFPQTVTEDLHLRPNKQIPGKTEIMLHIGYTHTGQSSTGDGSGSAGCLVSPAFYSLRDYLIQIYQAEYIALYNTKDHYLEKLIGLDHEQSIDVWRNTEQQTEAVENIVPRSMWDNKLIGELWLIRPDERPLG